MCEAVLSTMAAVGARADFERARRGYLAARVGRLFKARRPSRTRPRDLGDVAALFWHSTRLRSIPLDAIVGTVDATTSPPHRARLTHPVRAHHSRAAGRLVVGVRVARLAGAWDLRGRLRRSPRILGAAPGVAG
jgi:hypothetical protein